MNPSTLTPTSSSSSSISDSAAAAKSAVTSAVNTAVNSASKTATACVEAVTPALNAAGEACSKSATQVKEYVREHPTSSLIVAAGISLAALLVIRALTPPPPRNRAVRLLEDIQHRLAELAHPVYDRAASLAEDGAGVLSRGVDSLNDLQIDRRLGKLSRGIKSLFN